MGEEEKNRKRKEGQNKETGSEPPNNLNHSLASDDSHGSYGESILFNPRPTGGIIIIILIIIK